MSKLQKFSGELNLSKRCIEFHTYADAFTHRPTSHFVRIFLTLKKQALVEVVFAGEGSCTESSVSLWSWDNNDGAPDSFDRVGKKHPKHDKLIWRGKLIPDPTSVFKTLQYDNDVSSLTNTERAVYSLIVDKFLKYSKNNSVRFMLGL